MATLLPEEPSVEYELAFLKEQVKSLQQFHTELQDEIETKNKVIINLTKEKERLVYELKNYKRSNLNLKQQLEDERAIHLKEKEFYSRELNENKLLRTRHSEQTKTSDGSKEIQDLNTQINELKKNLMNTLEANYNLSVKFLRMKNTKYSLQAKLKREEIDNSKVISYLISNLETIREEINFIISDKFRQIIPPSNKKYLQVVKQNTQLLYENLNLQLKVRDLHSSIENLKAERVRFETSLRLQYTKKRPPKSRKPAEIVCKPTAVSSATNISTFGDPLRILPRSYSEEVKQFYSAPEISVRDMQNL